MQLLNPTTLLIAAALTIPPLIALYFLKLRRTVYPISSTLLWRKAIEDLHVNAPFQRLRSSLLLFLQLLVLVLAAFALGQPMLAREKPRERSLILLIDHSASMSVLEQNNRTRLDIAKTEAKKVIDTMDEHSRAMVIAFCDRATMVSSFDTDKEAIKRRIDDIEQTDSLSMLGEAVALAEAYSQSMIIGGETPGSDIQVPTTAEPPSVILFSDGQIADAGEVSPQRLDLSRMEVVLVGRRRDNVGIIAMDARRNYEHPELVQAFVTVRNFAGQSMTFDATLFIDRQPVDVQSVTLEPGAFVESPAPDVNVDEDTSSETADSPSPPPAQPTPSDATAPVGSVAAIAFDQVEFEGEGVVEARLSLRDALETDNRAWTVIPPPRHVDVLLVTDGNFLLERLLRSLNITVQTMTPVQYERAADEDLIEGRRSRFDVVILDGHDTARLPTGNYMFWGSAPMIDGLQKLGMVENEAIIDWDEDHPVLRNVPVGTLNIFAWLRLKLPPDTVRLIEGESNDSTVLAYFTQGGSQFLICAFPFQYKDDAGDTMDNTDWPLKPDFVLFNADAVQFLASALDIGGLGALKPGEPKTVPIPRTTESVTIRRPDGLRDRLPTAGSTTVTYARTRTVGVYTVEPAVEGAESFTVNLACPEESRVDPRKSFFVGASPVSVVQGNVPVNQPIWAWFVLGLLAISLIEWVIYNRRVYV